MFSTDSKLCIYSFIPILISTPFWLNWSPKYFNVQLASLVIVNFSNYPDKNLVKVPHNGKWSTIHPHNPENCLLLCQISIAALHVHAFPPRLISSLFTLLNQDLRPSFHTYMQHFNFHIMLEDKINLEVLKNIYS